ncbi:sugar-phosphatase [Sinosporangium album]|uniref:Sugar-phosphatase n=1 Tax=Sinosporangium album TaxID=504805 RepID=A0A1G8JCC8_9ACTN|nr:sugar-phosphatase [Sinosporangium album]
MRDAAPALDATAERKVLNALMEDEGDAFPAAGGAAELLGALREHPWALVTSGSCGPVRRRFELADLPLPLVQIYGEDVEQCKPHPDGYLKAARLLGMPPSNCVVVEDAPHGVTAGKRAGCTVVALATTHSADDLREADHCFPSLEQAAPHLLAMSGKL